MTEEKKEVYWPEAKIGLPLQPGQFRSIKDLFKSFNDAPEPEDLTKAMPIMEALFNIRVQDRTPFTVTEPIQYEADRLMQSEHGAKFVPTQCVIPPGTQIMLKSIDEPMRQFLFEDQQGQEHVLPFEAKEDLIRKTDIYTIATNHFYRPE